MNPEIIPFTTEDGYVFYVETTPLSQAERQKVTRGKVKDKIQESWESIKEKAPVVFEKSLAPLKGVVGVVMRQLQEIKESPDEVTLEMGIKLSAEAGVVLTQAGGEAHFKLTIKWKDSDELTVKMKEKP
jgi:hypothetical protein